MKKIIWLIFAFLMTFNLLAAQETFQVGDAVEALRGSQWSQGRVESIENRRIKIRFGAGKYDFQIYEYPTSIVRKPGIAEREAKEDKLRWDFRAEALDKYYRTVAQFAPFHDNQYLSGGSPITPAEWQTAMKNLT